MSKSVLTLSTNESIEDTAINITNGYNDGLVVRSGGGSIIADVTIKDHRTAPENQRAHCDAIQIIPDDGTPRGQYGLAKCDDILIYNVDIYAEGSKLQGIFCGDGLIDYINIAAVVIDTDSEHKITLTGVINGDIFANHDVEGRDIFPTLLPAAVGGTPKIGKKVFPRVEILSFKDWEDDYKPVYGTTNDLRRTPRQHVINLERFDLKRFYSMRDELPEIEDVNLNCLALQYIAVQCGEVVGNKNTDYLKKFYEQALESSMVIEEKTIKPFMSQYGMDLLIESEGYENHLYFDQAGLKTIGVGHLLTRNERTSGDININGELVSVAGGISEAQVKQLLAQDLIRFEQAVNDLVKVPLNQNQFDALVHFAFNVGVTAFGNSTLLRYLNSGNYLAVPEQIMRWKYITVKGKRKVSRGLINRRVKEVNMWNGNSGKQGLFGGLPGGEKENAAPVDPDQPKAMTESKIGNTALLSMVTSMIGIIGSMMGWELSGTDVATLSSSLVAIFSGLIWYFRRYKTTQTVDRTI
jgi:lysozyme